MTILRITTSLSPSAVLRTTALGAAILGTAACGGGAEAGSAEAAFEVIDSAGVEVIHNSVPAADGLAVLDRVESLRIGVREGPPELELFNVRDVIVGPEDEVYAAFQNDGEIRVYGPDGNWLRTMGGQGEGPGEFRFVSWIGLFGDTLLAFDPRLYRVTALSRQGDLIANWPVRREMASILPRARSDEGWLISVDDYSRRVEYDIGRPGTDTIRIALVSSIPDAMEAIDPGVPPWESLDVIVQHPAWTTWGIGQPGGPLFGRHALWAPTPQNAFDASGHIYVTNGEDYEIDVYDSDGTLVRRVTRSHEPVPITAALKNRYRAEVMAHYDTTSTTGEAGLDLVAAAEQHIALPGPDHLPALGRIVVSDEGAIWIERPDLVDDPLLSEWSRAGYQAERWDAFDPDGRFIGTIEMPVRSTLHVVGSDWFIVTQRDELDVQYIVKYTLAR